MANLEKNNEISEVDNKINSNKLNGKTKRTFGNIVSLVVFYLLIAIFVGIIVAFAIGYKPAIVLTGSMTPSIDPGDVTVYKSVDFDDLKIWDVIMFSGKDAGSESDSTSITNVTHRIVNILYFVNESDVASINEAFTTEVASNSAGFFLIYTNLEINDELDLLSTITVIRKEYRTHGDANNSSTSYESYKENIYTYNTITSGGWPTEEITEAKFIGKVFLVIPWIGIPLNFIKNNLFVIIFGAIAIFALWYLIILFKTKDSKRVEE